MRVVIKVRSSESECSIAKVEGEYIIALVVRVPESFRRKYSNIGEKRSVTQQKRIITSVRGGNSNTAARRSVTPETVRT